MVPFRNFGGGTLVDVNIEDLREDFRRLRRRRKLSQINVAQLLNVSQATISSFEHGKHGAVRPRTLLGIHEIVTFWKNGSERSEIDPNSSRAIFAPPEEVSASGTKCLACGSELPVLGDPIRFCPFCCTPQGELSTCGHRELEGAGQFCRLCGSAIDSEFIDSVSANNLGLRQLVLECLIGWSRQSGLIDHIVRELDRKIPRDSASEE